MSNMDEFAQAAGFADAKEMNTFVASVDISDPGKLARFEHWKESDGTKHGLQQLTQPTSKPEKRLRVFSFGGGVQSHAVMILQAEGKLTRPYDVFMFANVGDDSENPDTIKFLEKYTLPYAGQHGLTFMTVARRGRTVREQATRQDLRSVVIPAYKGTGPSAKRNCTDQWKIKVIDQGVRALGASHCEIGLGISLDEIHRARSEDWHDRYISQSGKTTTKLGFWRRREYPLIDLRLTRAACNSIIDRSGLPPVPKSACFFCPFKHPANWIELKQTNPDLFAQAIEIENALNAKGLPGDPYYLHTYKKPLADAVSDQLMLFNETDNCESGYCHT